MLLLGKQQQPEQPEQPQSLSPSLAASSHLTGTAKGLLDNCGSSIPVILAVGRSYLKITTLSLLIHHRSICAVRLAVPLKLYSLHEGPCHEHLPG